MQFKDVIGQKDLINHLLVNGQSGRNSHAQLFLGAEGSGALPVVLAYAQYINCLQPTASDSCGTCSSCSKYSKLIHPDLHFSFPSIAKKSGDKVLSTAWLPDWRKAIIENPYLTYTDWMNKIADSNKMGNISVAECQDIISRLALAAFEGKFKVLVMWLPEFLREAGNVLLKIIEEPPPKTIFLLVAEKADAILTTITSRTQLIKVPRIETQDLAKYLEKVHAIAPDEAFSIALLAEGSYTEALRLMQADISLNETLLKEWLRSIYGQNAGNILRWLTKINELGREKQKNFLQYTQHFLRSCFLFNYDANALVRLQGSEKEFLQKFAPHLGKNTIEQLNQHLNIATTYIERNANGKLVFHQLTFVFEKAFQRHKAEKEALK